MKRKYQTPKCKAIDFCYDEQVTAASNEDWGKVGDPNSVGLCQQQDPSKCLAFWYADTAGTTCRMDPIPWSLRG